jgi:hypothetical protein
MDGDVELLKSQVGTYFGDRQHSHATVLQGWQATAYGPAIHFLSLDTHRLQNFCRHRYLRFLHNGSVAFFRDQPATTAIKVLTGLGLGWQVLQVIGSLEGAWYMPLSLWQLVRKAMGGPFSACTLLELLAL